MSGDGIDKDALATWLDAETKITAAISLSRIRGGGSCEMFEMQRGGERWVIRRAPLSSSTAHDVVREFKIISALQGGRIKYPSCWRCRRTTGWSARHFTLCAMSMVK